MKPTKERHKSTQKETESFLAEKPLYPKTNFQDNKMMKPTFCEQSEPTPQLQILLQELESSLVENDLLVEKLADRLHGVLAADVPSDPDLKHEVKPLPPTLETLREHIYRVRRSYNKLNIIYQRLEV